jgi:hypothetical protein
MRPLLVPIRITASALLMLFATVTFAEAQDHGKPLLSEEIRRVLETDGREAARRRFEEIFPKQSDRYEMDLEGLSLLGTEQIQANDMASAQVVFSMVAALGQSLDVSGKARAQQAERNEREGARQAREGRPVASGPGQARDDLKRFAGWYGEPNQQRDPPRSLFARETCDGYLVAGASWGDASPWYLTSVSATSFEDFSEGIGSFSIEFEVDGDGNPVAMIHSLENMGLPSRLQYLGPLEDDRCWTVEWGPETPG